MGTVRPVGIYYDRISWPTFKEELLCSVIFFQLFDRNLFISSLIIFYIIQEKYSWNKRIRCFGCSTSNFKHVSNDSLHISIATISSCIKQVQRVILFDWICMTQVEKSSFIIKFSTLSIKYFKNKDRRNLHVNLTYLNDYHNSLYLSKNLFLRKNILFGEIDSYKRKEWI